jgi:CheY-like chemotaxis protein
MVYGFVRQSGGHVRAESRLGYGTRIDLLRPLARGGAGAVRPVATEEAGSDVDPGGDEALLVVEDDPEVRRVTVAFLRSLGYHVDDVASAEEALDHVKHHPGVALVLSDVVLGSGKSGIELLQELDDLRPDLPVLLTSGYEHETLQQLGISAGRFELLQKPYRRRQLALLLRRKLDAATD